MEIQLFVCTDLKCFFFVQISFVLMAYPSNIWGHSVNRCHSLNEAAEGFFNLHRKRPGPCRISWVDLEGRDKSFGRSECEKGWVDSAHADQAQCFASCRLRRNFILCLRQFATYYSWKCSLENDYLFLYSFYGRSFVLFCAYIKLSIFCTNLGAVDFFLLTSTSSDDNEWWKNMMICNS